MNHWYQRPVFLGITQKRSRHIPPLPLWPMQTMQGGSSPRSPLDIWLSTWKNYFPWTSELLSLLIITCKPNRAELSYLVAVITYCLCPSWQHCWLAICVGLLNQGASAAGWAAYSGFWFSGFISSFYSMCEIPPNSFACLLVWASPSRVNPVTSCLLPGDQSHLRWEKATGQRNIGWPLEIR